MGVAPHKRHHWLRRGLFLAAIIAGSLSIGLWIMSNRQTLLDQIIAWQHPLNSAVATVADTADLTARSHFLLQATQAQINDRANFNRHCTNQDESQSIVLGCYTGQIYVFDVSDPSVSGIKTVILAHEMLHAAYARLPPDQKNQINQEIRAYIPQIKNADIRAALPIYGKTEPGEELNELHSLLGTEEANLPPSLENYYKTYFTDRDKVVSAYAKYAAVFATLQRTQAQLSGQLKTLKTQIEQATENYQTAVSALSSDIDAFNSCARQAGCFAPSAFTVQRANLATRQQNLSTTADAINAKINDYNNDVNQLNALGVEAQRLNSSVDSRAPALE